MNQVELAVIGGGPAGMAAALAAAELGLDVHLFEEREELGGQILRSPHSEKGLADARSKAKGVREQVLEMGIPVSISCMAWGIQGNRVFMQNREGFLGVQAEAVILASGARELVYPFPGWTLPGVMTSGAMQCLIHGNGKPPEGRILIAGSSPISLTVGREILTCGGDLTALLQSYRPLQLIAAAQTLLGKSSRRQEAWRSVREILRSTASLLWGHVVLEARGGSQLESVVVAPLTRSGEPDRGRSSSFPARWLCLGYGFVPNIELAAQAGCELVYQEGRGGWIPRVSERLMTTRPGFFASGEIAGIGGAELSLLEGTLSGTAAAAFLKGNRGSDIQQRIEALSREREKELAFGRAFVTAFHGPKFWVNSMPSHTVICRCEGVSLAELRQAYDHGLRTMDGLKMAGRAGQGRCQGRYCGPILEGWLRHHTHLGPDEIGRFKTRPPVKPVRVKVLLRDGENEYTP